MTMTVLRAITPDGRSAEFVDVTPEVAEGWLGKNTRNRHLRPSLVAAYARDMSNGDWLAGGDSILFDRAGTLLDGQHRLAAIRESGVSIRMLVVDGVDPGAQDVTDVGPGRSFSDVLSLRGEVNVTGLASVVRAVALWEKGARQGALGGAGKPTVPEMLRLLAANPDLRDATA